MIFINTNPNSREAINPSHNNHQKQSIPNLANQKNSRLSQSKQNFPKNKKQSCGEITAKVLAILGSLGLLAGIGLIIFGVIEYIKPEGYTVGVASIASGSVLVFASGVSLIIVACILCNHNNQVRSQNR